ncbi:MAG: IclR family transcriptional regulator [Pseudomonadota bacterium]
MSENAGTGSAIQKAFRLLDAIVETNGPAALVDIAETAQLPKASAHRMLLQLEEVGAVVREPDGKRFFIGARMAQLALGALRASTKVAPIREVMKALMKQTGESCNLGVLDADAIVYIERVESDFPLRMHFSAGSRVPPHCTAVGKLLIAHLPERKRLRLLEALPRTRFTPHTLVEVDALEAEFARIRDEGRSVNREEYQAGLIGLAVPVRDADGHIIAGLAIHAPVVRMPIDVALAHEPVLRAAATAIGDELTAA